ncbi:PHR domain [Mactra antiquata]
MDNKSTASDDRSSEHTKKGSVTKKAKISKDGKPRKLTRIPRSINLVKLMRLNRVQPQNEEPAGDEHEEDKPNEQTNSVNDNDQEYDDTVIKDLYQQIMEYRRQYCIDKTPGKSDVVTPGPSQDNNADTTDTLEITDIEKANEQCDRSSKDDISTFNEKSADSSTTSTPSWADLSPRVSPVNDEHEVNKKCSDYYDTDGYLYSREYRFPQYGDALESLDTGQQDLKDTVTINDPDCDVAIMVGKNQEVIHAHAQVLINQSQEFADLLADQNHLRYKFVMLPDFRRDVVENIIRFFYEENIELTIDMALAILKESGHIGSQTLREECLWFLLIEITSSIASDILEYAHKYEFLQVYDQCLRFIHINAVDVFKEDNFYNLCEQCVDGITKSDYLRAEEFLVFETLMSYADKKCVEQKLDMLDINRRKVLGNVFFNVRFAVLKLEVFTNSINKRKLLQPNEKKDILMLLNGKPLIKRHSYNLEPRKKYKIKQYFSKVRLAKSRNTIKSEASGTELHDEKISPLVHSDSGVGSQTPGSTELIHAIAETQRLDKPSTSLSPHKAISDTDSLSLRLDKNPDKDVDVNVDNANSNIQTNEELDSNHLVRY